jgi:hypothetical protein
MLQQIQNCPEWRMAFTAASLKNLKAAHVEPEDIEVALATDPGDANGTDWTGVFILKNGDYLFLEAGYDLSEDGVAWGGDLIVSESLDDLIPQMGNLARERLHRQLKPFVTDMVIISKN